MRNRLIELIKQGDKTFTDKYTGKVMLLIDKIEEIYDFIADYLLENGVIVPPCKVGDVLWVIDKKRESTYKFKVDCIKLYEDGLHLHGYVYPNNKWGYPTEYTLNQNTFKKLFRRTKQEAEQALAKMKGGEG